MPTIAARLLYGLARLILGDRGALLTTVLISIALRALAAGAERLRKAHDHRLAQTPEPTEYRHSGILTVSSLPLSDRPPLIASNVCTICT